MEFLFILIIIGILFVIGYFAIGNYFYNIALNPKTDKAFVLGNPEVTEEEKEYIRLREEWINNNSNDVYITSTNNGSIKLHAYEVKSDIKTDVWTIVIHGYMSKGNEMMWAAKPFADEKYNVLIPDLRGHGLSEGNYIGMGWDDRLDIIDWINYIIKKNPDSKIILWGVSMGAATTMMTTGEELPKNVKVAIADCGYSSAWDQFAYQLKRLFKLPTFPVLNAANTVCKIRAGYSFKDASCIKQLKKSKTPTLFIHGSADDFVPFSMLDVVYNAAACEKEKLVIEGAGHGLSSTVNTELYLNTINKFIEKYL